jgi:ferredoxin
MRVEVDPLQCGCSGYCVKLAPALFGWLPQGGAARVRKAPETDEEQQLAREAADLCPTRAIVLRESAGGRRL